MGGTQSQFEQLRAGFGRVHQWRVGMIIHVIAAGETFKVVSIRRVDGGGVSPGSLLMSAGVTPSTTFVYHFRARDGPCAITLQMMKVQVEGEQTVDKQTGTYGPGDDNIADLGDDAAALAL